MELMLFVLVLVVIIAVLLAFFSKSSQVKYLKRGALFSPAERSFLGVLEKALESEYRILGKVRIADVLTPERGHSRKKWQIAFNKISAKHFDFVLCHVNTLEVIAVVELDDKSHNRQKAKARDQIVQSACESSGLPLIRFAAKASYQIRDIRHLVETAINLPVEQ